MNFQNVSSPNDDGVCLPTVFSPTVLQGKSYLSTQFPFKHSGATEIMAMER
jgi:hypothetical protein